MSKPRKLPSGRWQAYINITEGGKRKQVALGTFASRRDALDATNAAEAARRVGQFTRPSDGKILAKTWIEQWYKARLASSRKVRSFLDARILPQWQDWRLVDIRLSDVRAWVKEMSQTDLNPSTVRDIYETMKLIMADAVDERLIPQTPCRLRAEDLPKLRPSEYVFLTQPQGKVLETLAPARFRAMVHLALWGGLRWGELAALTWDNVDLEAGWVAVMCAVKTNGKVGPPKNNKHRRVRIAPATVEVLRAHRRDFGSTDLLFTTTRGHRQLSYANFRTYVWAPLVKKSLIAPAPTFHDLRHTHCSWMIAQGMDWLVLSDRMGHHKPSFTMDVYGHLRHDSDEVVVAALEAAMAV